VGACRAKVGRGRPRAPKVANAVTGRAVRSSEHERSGVGQDSGNWLMRLAFLLAAGGVAGLVPLTLMRFVGRAYPWELFTHFQVQYLVAAAVAALVLAGLRHWWWSAVAVGCLAVAATAVLPYLAAPSGAAAHASAGTRPRPTLRLLLANVLVGNRAHDRVVGFARAADADVLVFQEVDEAWVAALDELKAEYPYTVSEPQEDCTGLAVFSRLALSDTEVVSPGGTGRATVVLHLSVGGRPVSIVATHPSNPGGPAALARRNAQLDGVGAFARGLEGPVILIGDLNVTMWSPCYRRFRERAGLTNARHGFGVLPSWPAFLPAILRIPIDHCLVSDDVVVTDCRLGPRVGSDHLPLLVDVSLP
jgi:endonuclease/exonuclease/phosphatase (EEP) superfamily protein YafD